MKVCFFSLYEHKNLKIAYTIDVWFVVVSSRVSCTRYAGIIHVLSLIGHLVYLIAMYLDKDQGTITIKKYV